MTGERKARELMALVQLAGASGDQQVRGVVELAALTGNKTLVELVERLVEPEAISRIVSGYPFYVPMRSDEIAGPVEIGTELYRGHRVGLDPNYGHILVLGATRMGKTNLVMVLLRGLLG